MACSNDFFEVILNTKKTKLGSHTYSRRAKLLLRYKSHPLKDHHTIKNLQILDCATNVGSLMIKLLETYSSYKETTNCSIQECLRNAQNLPAEERMEKKFPVFNVQLDDMRLENFSTCLLERKKKFEDKNKQCTREGCSGKEKICASVGE